MRFLLILILIPVFSFSQTKAFPVAYGAAWGTTGARGALTPTVYKVTNLNDTGAGSFRDAVSSSDRFIVFDVSGTIELTGLTITASNLTIAGQTAPVGGITLTGTPINISNASNIIIRYVRFRPDYNDTQTVDGINVTNCDDIIMDHISLSWGGDEAMSIIGDSDTWTVSNSIIGESSTGMLAGDSNSNISSNISIHGNLWYNISHRFPNANASRTDVINNVVHNWYTRIMVVSAHDNVQLNEINNYYQRGSRPTNVLDAGQVSGNWLDIGSASQRANIRIYTSGNVINDVLAATDNQWNAPLYRHRFNITSGAYAGTNQWDAANTDFQALTPFELLGADYPFISAQDSYNDVLYSSGACRTLDGSGNVILDWDTIDDRYLGYVRTNTYDYVPVYPADAITTRQHYIDWHSAVSSTPVNSRAGGYDTDSDGMPDVWESAYFGDLTQTAFGDLDGDGYFNIEEFINIMDNPNSPSLGGSSTPNKKINETSGMLISH